jgi:hypothetical protein
MKDSTHMMDGIHVRAHMVEAYFNGRRAGCCSN